MPGDGTTYGVEELRFFGSVVASAAHEWGNVLAVIQESAGLLDDLVCLAGRGQPLEPERLAGLAATVTRQVRRGNDLLGNLRHLAHAVDTSCRAVDLAEAGAVMTALARRLASQHEVGLTAVPGGTVRLTCDPYRLCRLVYVCLVWAVTATGAGGGLELTTRPEEPGLVITGLPETLPALSAEVEQAAAHLEAAVRTEPGRLVLRLPGAVTA